jgi:DNA (cytosine-5)-methyltransferase 1
MKVLNLYAGIGGNRKLWQDVEVTAVEINPEIAAIYQNFFPNDKVIVADAHDYLLRNHKRFDFIWSSIPCQSNSRARFWASTGGKYPVIYPDLSLYQEVIFLKYHADCKWVVENVVPYYEPLIPGQLVGRHLFWANFYISNFKKEDFQKDSIAAMQKQYGFNLSGHKISQRKDQILRNCVQPELGKHVLGCAIKQAQKLFTVQPKAEQVGLF